MSITIDYFFNFAGSFSELVTQVNACLGCDLKPYEGNAGDLFHRFLSMELSLGKHTYENDGDLDFEAYTFAIGIRNPVPDGDIRDMVSSVMGIVPALLYRRCGIRDGILVFDGQKLLARYTESHNGPRCGLFDTVGSRLVEFPEHIGDINSRIGPPWQL
jgi:hypothetical protein